MRSQNQENDTGGSVSFCRNKEQKNDGEKFNEIVQGNFPEMKEMSLHRHCEKKRFTQRSACNVRTLEIKDLKIFFGENTVPIQWKNDKTC